MVTSVTDNPFAVMLIAAPAVFTDASSVALGKGNRLGAGGRPDASTGARNSLNRSQRGNRRGNKGKNVDAPSGASAKTRRVAGSRYELLLRGPSTLFAAASLISTQYRLPFEAVAAISFIAGTVGFIGLVVGCIFLVNETRLALRSIYDEADWQRAGSSNRSGTGGWNLRSKP